MLNEKQTLTVNNKMELGENISDEAKGKGRQFVSRFIEPGVAHYQEFGDVLITKETLDKFINTMVGCPVIIQHKDIDDKNVDDERVGVVSKVWFNEADGWFYCEGIIWDKQAIDLVKNQDWSVSCTYDFDSDNQPKTHNGKKIDREFTGGEFLHLALVPNPRYERANIVMNSIENAKDWDGNEGDWITVNGNHLFIKKGQSKDEAVKSFIEKQQDKKENKQSDAKDKPEESQYSEGRLKGEINSLEEEIEDMDDELRTLSDKLRKSERAIDKYSRDKARGYKEDIETLERKIKNKEAQLDKLYKEQESRKESSKDKSGDKKEESKGVQIDEKLHQGLKDEIQKAHTDEWYTRDKDKNYAGIRGFIRQSKQLGEWFDANPGKSEWIAAEAIGLLKLNEFKSLTSKKQKDIINELYIRFKEHNNTTSNNAIKKEITMTVLNELKDFIKNVVKNEKDEEMKEVKNEDKRKLIDEVGGILKGKVDDEIIKTIMKKMEEASYEPSEDDKADNEADEEEKEEKFEEEKEVANKKAKNEEKEAEDKEVEKEEVKNKCKNSMNDVKSLIMGGSSKVKSNYITKEERFALGENY